jgi:Uncharacterised nucleotidyltransferase
MDVTLLASSPLMKQLLQLDHEALHTVKNEHGLWGISALQSTDSAKLPEPMAQKQKNIVFLDEFSQLQQAFAQQTGSPLTPLKGLSLLPEIYGSTLQRPMTDMDVYTQLPERLFTDVFTRAGYQLQNERKWRYNKHKFLFKKQHPLMELNFEVHTDLVPRTQPFAWQLDVEGRLAKDEEFLYLCFHWAEQHTCLKLFWLFDLYFFIQKNPLDSQKLWNKAVQLKITSSLLAAHWALKNCFQVELLQNISNRYALKSFLLRNILTPLILTRIHQKRFTYLVLKQLLKDEFYKNVVYTFLWIKHKYQKPSL